MLKILLLIGLLFVFSDVTVSGEQFQACDSASVEKDPRNFEYNAHVWREELMKVKDAVQDNPQQEKIDGQRFYTPPDIQVPCQTKYLAQITWPSGASLYEGGGVVKYDDILQKPKVIWPCHGSRFYGLIVADMDSVLIAAGKGDTDDKSWQDYLWFIFNIPGNKIDQGVEVKPYRTPTMDAGSRRLILAIHEQANRINIDTDRSETVADKAFFEVFKTFNGTLTAGNIFTVERSTARLPRWSNISTMKTSISLLLVILTTSKHSTQVRQFQAADDSIDDVSSFNGINKQALESFKTELAKVKELSGNLPCTTQFCAKVTWPSGVSPPSGGKVKYDDILVTPKVIWPCYGSKFYGMIFADMEALVATDPTMRTEYLWFVYNIPGNQVDRGVEAVPYRPPTMKNNTHIITVMIHEQTQLVEINEPNLSEETRVDKAMMAALESFNGTLAAGTLFTVEKFEDD